MDRVDVDGLHVGLERVGSGPPLVLLHGYVGDGPAAWRAQLQGLADDFTVAAWDAPGAGRSSDPPDDFGMVGYADCLAGFIARLGLNGRMWPGCRSAVRWPLSCPVGIPQRRRP